MCQINAVGHFFLDCHGIKVKVAFSRNCKVQASINLLRKTVSNVDVVVTACVTVNGYRGI